MKDYYVRFNKEKQGIKGDAVTGHGPIASLEHNIQLGIVQVGDHIYEYKGTVVEEEEDVFEEVKEAIVVGKTYTSGNRSRWYCAQEISDGYLFVCAPNAPTSTQNLYWKFDKDGVSEYNNGQYKLILATKKISTSKKCVLKVL